MTTSSIIIVTNGGHRMVHHFGQDLLGTGPLNHMNTGNFSQ